VEYGAHLPLIELNGHTASLRALREYAGAAAGLGYSYLCANDHLLFSRPWLDGPTAFAAVLDRADGMTLATTVCLPVVRGPVQAAKMLGALDVLSGGRLIVGVGPGSSARDYDAVGLPFDGRWSRFEEASRALRALLHPGSPPFEGTLYRTRASSSSLRRRRSPGRRSGSAAGARSPGSAASPGSATAGSPRGTTRPRGPSLARARISRPSSSGWARRPRASRTRSRRCGST
jgi:alkanesulfonate monooxygenase SsuD/methylene tetrahydromethanopterin reductase-like flavin-dependent oxidoreductase (luciferase family)